MKKNLLLLPIMLVAACSIRAGKHELPVGGITVDRSDSYSAKLYDANTEARRLVKSEYIEERNFKLKENQVAKRGASVLNNKIYRRDFYVKNELKADKNARMHSASVPYVIKKNETRRIMGEALINGERYRLLDSNTKNFVILVDDKGHIFDKMGQIKGGKLVLMPVKYIIEPKDVVFREVVSSSSVQTKPLKGFDIKYDGIQTGRMWFTYLDYENGEGNAGRFQQVSFPAKSGLIEINDHGFRVTSVNEDKIEYVVVK